MTHIVKRVIHSFLKKMASYPGIRRIGHIALHPFPKIKGWVIRLLHAGKYSGHAAYLHREGYGERQQHLINGLEQRKRRQKVYE